MKSTFAFLFLISGCTTAGTKYIQTTLDQLENTPYVIEDEAVKTELNGCIFFDLLHPTNKAGDKSKEQICKEAIEIYNARVVLTYRYIRFSEMELIVKAYPEREPAIMNEIATVRKVDRNYIELYRRFYVKEYYLKKMNIQKLKEVFARTIDEYNEERSSTAWLNILNSAQQMNNQNQINQIKNQVNQQNNRSNINMPNQ